MATLFLLLTHAFQPMIILTFAANADLIKGINVRPGINNVYNKRAPWIGNNNNPLLLGGNQLAPAYDVLGRYLFLGITAKY